jgi:hypothetical protein
MCYRQTPLGWLPERAASVYLGYVSRLSRRWDRLDIAIVRSSKDDACVQGVNPELGADLAPDELLRFRSLCRSLG